MEVIKSSALTPIPLPAISENEKMCVRRNVVLQSWPKKKLTDEVFRCSLNFAIEHSDQEVDSGYPKSTAFYVGRGIDPDSVFVLHDLMKDNTIRDPSEPEIHLFGDAISQADKRAPENFIQTSSTDPLEDSASNEMKNANAVAIIVDQKLYVSGLYKIQWITDYKVVKIA
jgi:hypothetical protein